MICMHCGERKGRANWACMMSDDGEGPHAWVRDERIEREFLLKIEEHQEQGASER